MATNDDSPTICPKWLERFKELRAVCRLKNEDVSRLAGISIHRIRRYSGAVEKRPIICLAEAMEIARCFAAAVDGRVPAGQILAYLADEKIEDGLPAKAIGDALRLRLRLSDEPKAANVINERRIEPPKSAKPRRSSRAEAKRKHL